MIGVNNCVGIMKLMEHKSCDENIYDEWEGGRLRQ